MILTCAHFVIVAGIPLCFLFFPSVQRRIPSAWLRFLTAIIFVWLVLQPWRLFVEMPIARANARAAGDLDYDGVGGNAAILLAGWIEPLIFGLVPFIIKVMWDKKEKSQHPPAA